MVLIRQVVRCVSKWTGAPTIPRDIYGSPVDVTKPHQASKLTHLSNAEEWVHKIPPIVVDDDVVRCSGVQTMGMGHPVVYIQLNKKDPSKPEMCKWCSLRYVKNPALAH